MNIIPIGAHATRRAPAEWFTGTVWQDPIIETPAPARLRAVRVTFEAGARTAWHTHPLGQTLLVLSGVGRVQAEGGPLRRIRPGDTVWIAPGEKHWHGADPTIGMVHLAMQESLDGVQANWLEQVSDEIYAATPASE
jgi:quercetin dioxygenase-like cupin family protein